MIIRELLKEDIYDLYLLNRNELGYDYPLEKMKDKCLKIMESPSDKVFVAVKGNCVVGYVHACDYDVIYMDHMKNIMGIAVLKNERHLGIGKKLLNEVEKWAISTGAKGVRLVSGETRIGAHEFYKSCAYELKKKQMYFIKTL